MIFIIYNIVICKVSKQHIGIVLKSVTLSMIKVIPLFALLKAFDLFTGEYHLLSSLLIKTTISLLYFMCAIKFGLYNDIPLPSFVGRWLKHN